MCFGKEINSDVLKLIKDEMNTLVTSVEVNKDAWMQDHKGLKENLCNLTKLFGLEIERLEAKHVALESSLKELEGDQAKINESLNGLAQGVDKLISKRNLFFKTGNGFSKKCSRLWTHYMIILLDEVFVMSEIIKVEVIIKINNQRPRLITLTKTLIIYSLEHKFFRVILLEQ